MAADANISESDPGTALGAAGRPTLAGRFQIDPATVLDALSRPSARAYAAIDLNEPLRPIYAVLANPRAPVRVRAIHQTRQMENACFTAPVRIGSVEWPASGRSETAIILPRPGGLPLMEDLNGKIEPLLFSRLQRVILPAITEMLGEMETLHVAHRAIRPDNIFIDPENNGLIVGECFSVPGGFSQPSVFEPIERAMCPPTGRGEGETADDLFALGVTALFLAFGENPVVGIDEETLIQRRREIGSYAAIVGKRRVPPELIQMIRALLRDNPEERWNVEDLLAWLHAGRGSVGSGAAKIECDRPFEFEGEKYRSAPDLAMGLAAHFPEALETVKAGDVEKWVDKALKDKRCKTALVKCRASGANGSRTVSDDLLMARTLTALDPLGPLRYRRINVMPDGIGALMASFLDDGARLGQVVEMLNGMLPTFWIEQKERPTYSMFGVEEALVAVLPLLARSAAGFGVERVLYELNPALTCQSPLLLDANVSDGAQLLKALDSRVTGVDTILDRHIAAFLATRISGSVDRDLNDVALARSTGEKLLAQLRFFSYVQSKSDAPALPALCRYFIDRSPAILETYRNIPLRAKLARMARTASESGELSKIESVLASEKNRRWDTNGFNSARQQYRRDEAEIANLQASIATIPDRSRSAGKQIGAMMAGVMSMAAMVVVMLTQMF